MTAELELVIIGAGISGLTAASKMAEYGVERVVLLEHHQDPGGYARLGNYSDEFAEERALIEQSMKLPYDIRRKATAVGFFQGDDGAPHRLYVQTPQGTESIQARRILIATGSLEKPREAHKIAGPRPAGIMTPSLALELLERGYTFGVRPAVYMNSRLSASALAAIKRSHSRVTAIDGASTDVVRVWGTARLEAITVRSRDSGLTQELVCDTLVYAKGRYPSTFFLKGSSVERNEDMTIRIDADGRTSVPGVFAAGSCTSLGDDDHRHSIRLAERAAAALLQTMKGGR